MDMASYLLGFVVGFTVGGLLAESDCRKKK